MIRKCKTCKEEKDLDEFFPDKSYKYGRTYKCYECYNFLGREQYAKKPMRIKKSKPTPEQTRAHKLMFRYKMTIEQYDQMLKEQKGVCAICWGTNSTDKRLFVDHDHRCCPGERSCGKCVRGLLCSNCNRAEGSLKGSAAFTLRLLDYLVRSEPDNQGWMQANAAKNLFAKMSENWPSHPDLK